MVSFYAIRGATTVEENTSEAILGETKILLESICQENRLAEEEIVSIFFTMTSDLDATFPAEAAREIGFSLVPLICSQELNVVGAMEKCIRILMHVAGEKRVPVKHIYLNQAKALRPDWCQEERSDGDESST